ncbi:MAG: alpha/beta hydrolase [Chitinophagaceae bacterium]|nr:MAG: alpha/beta hydrolase [Chitinophagaceae bacterium]
MDSNSRLRAQMLSQFTQYQSSTFHYLFADRGDKVVVCFHGYDEHAGSYELPAELIPDHYSVISLDLPAHGRTEWREPSAFDAAAAWNIIGMICDKHSKRKDEVVLSGFSLGGRIALALYSFRPEAVDRLLLFAPDGLTYYRWYGFVTRSRIGRGLFKFTVTNPGWLLSAIRLGKKLRVLNPGTSKFSLYYLQEHASRALLFERWSGTRKLSVAPAVLSKQLKEFKTKMLLVYGTYDRIVRPVTGHRFCSKTGGNCRVIEISCGHQVFQQKNRAYLAEIISNELGSANQ